MTGTLTLNSAKVGYKKRRHPRQFKIWDSNLLNTAMIQASDVKHSLEEVALKENQTLAEMKPSLIASHILYHLVNSYLSLYEAGLKEGLIQSGSPKIQPTLH